MDIGNKANKNIDLITHKLDGADDLDPLLERIGESRYVLLGEASHGTHEYYTWRAKISKRLIEEKGFNYIAVEGDWPDCYEINKWIKGQTAGSITDIQHSFDRWPTWMWGNWEIAAFATWLKSHNEKQPKQKRIGFYGLDVYSLWESMEIISNYLEDEDPEAARLAREAIECFEPYRNTGTYRPAFTLKRPDCQKEVIKLLKEVRQRANSYNTHLEAGLNAEINALVVANAERYYRSLIESGENSWNIRDRHMMETLNILQDHHGTDAKVIVWAHNTHIGDARATDMADSGLINIGQLARDEHDDKGVVLVGFGSYRGSVIAGSKWGAKMKKMTVPEANSGSVEHLLHHKSTDNQLLIFNENDDHSSLLERTMDHRAIGVVYNPNREWGNYVPSEMTRRYDAFIFIDQTHALHPLKIEPDGHKTPDTFPFGM